MFLFVSVAIVFLSSQTCDASTWLEKMHAKYYYTGGLTGKIFGILYDCIDAILRFILPSKPTLYQTEDDKEKYIRKFKTEVRAKMDKAVRNYFANSDTSEVSIEDLDDGIKLENGALYHMENTAITREEYENKGPGTDLKCRLNFEMKGAMIRYRYKFSSGITHSGSLTVSLPPTSFTAVYKLGTEGRFWGIFHSECFIRLSSLTPDIKEMNIPSVSVVMRGQMIPDQIKTVVAQAVGKIAPKEMATVLDSALRSKGTTLYYCH